jgi:uroporphyrinogen-III decarboxylase
MTSKERIITAIRGGRPDRVPVAPMGLGRLDPQGDIARELIERTDPFLLVGIGSAFGSPVCRQETRWEGLYEVNVIHTPLGPLTQRRHRPSGRLTEWPCKTGDDVRKYLSIPHEPAMPDVTRFLAVRADIGENGLVLADVPNAVCLAANLLSPEDFCLLWADERDLFIQLVATAAERLLPFIDTACRLGVDAFRIIGGEYVTVQLGPTAVEAVLKPYDTEQVRMMHRCGAIAHYHNHGDLQRYLDDLAALGIDSLDPLEGPPFGNIDLAAAKRRLRGRVCLLGNLDDMEVLDKLDEETVKSMAKRCLEDAGPDGFILGGTSSGTYTERAARNFMAMVDVAEEMSA